MQGYFGERIRRNGSQEKNQPGRIPPSGVENQMAFQKIAVMGAGHGGVAAAADLTLRGFEVRLHARREDSLAPFRAAGGIRVRGVHEGLVPIELMTTNAAEAVAGADLVMLVVPAMAHEFYAAALAPVLRPTLPVFINPGHTGGSLHFVHRLRQAGYGEEVRACETVTLTYICRKEASDTVNIYSYTRNLKFAAFPGRHADALHDGIKALYPEIVAASSVLETALANINAVLHTPAMLMNAGWIEDTGGDFLFYRQGITPAVGRVIAEIDAERMAVAAALNVPSAGTLEFFHRAGLTTDAAAAAGDISRACRESAPNATIKSPPSLDHRYMHEDVGYGLVPFAALGDLAGIETPAIDALVQLCSVLMGIDYAATGLTLANMGLAGIAADDLARFMVEGGS
jgi:opine dehydrogenase